MAMAAIAGLLAVGMIACAEPDPDAVAEPADGGGLEHMTPMNRVLAGTVVAPADPVAAAIARVAVEMVKEGQDITPILQLYAERGGGTAKVNVTAAKDAAAQPGHFRRNWKRYAAGLVAAGGAHLVAEHNGGWSRLFGDDDDEPNNTTYNYNYTAGRDIVQGDGNTTGGGGNSGEGASSE
jgi:hypothetical protein